MKTHLDQYFKEPDDVDSVIKYVAVFDEYGLPIHDGGVAFVIIKYCPWCAKKLPKSRRLEWFEILEGLGFTSPLTDKIPAKFKSAQWYRE